MLSTFAEYSASVANAGPVLWEYGYDMMPYSDDGNRYFTGQFSSRPSIKTGLRIASQVLHAANKLYVVASGDYLSASQELE